MDDKIAALTQLFKEAGHAHHEAFIATDGAHAEWAAWYADYLHEKLPALLPTLRLDRDALTKLLEALAAEHKANAADSEWAAYYAQLVAERYG